MTAEQVAAWARAMPTECPERAQVRAYARELAEQVARRKAAGLQAEPGPLALAMAEAHYGRPPAGHFEQLAYWDAVGALAVELLAAP